jgi:hypothetical protein
MFLCETSLIFPVRMSSGLSTMMFSINSSAPLLLQPERVEIRKHKSERIPLAIIAIVEIRNCTIKGKGDSDVQADGTAEGTPGFAAWPAEERHDPPR